MKVRDIMNKEVEVVSPETLLHDVAKKMQQRDCGSVLVAKDDRLLGVITDRDLALRCVAQCHHPAETTAQQVMTPEILYCRDTDEVEAVALNMTQNKIRRLPVIDKDKRLVGIVSLGDLAVHSRDHIVCGRALAHICVEPGQIVKAESNQNNYGKKSGIAVLLLVMILTGGAAVQVSRQKIIQETAAIDINNEAEMVSLFDKDSDALAAQLNAIMPSADGNKNAASVKENDSPAMIAR